ncbi:MAG: hypothetical protein LBO67_02705, partial [Spirochaetaceae bacterium]|nr:hypothetical protein [Spirochaetaceae bacterium]
AWGWEWWAGGWAWCVGGWAWCVRGWAWSVRGWARSVRGWARSVRERQSAPKQGQTCGALAANARDEKYDLTEIFAGSHNSLLPLKNVMPLSLSLGRAVSISLH